MFTLDAACTVICSSTTIPPAPGLCPHPSQQLPAPLCSVPESSILGQRQETGCVGGCQVGQQPARTGNQLSRARG